VSQGIRSEDSGNFNVPSHGLSTCVTPNMRPWIAHRARLGHGLESLALQNIWFKADQMTDLLSHPNSLLQDLAGNAFNGSCCMAVMLTCIFWLASVVADNHGDDHARAGGRQRHKRPFHQVDRDAAPAPDSDDSGHFI